jgi:hypothetical protein
MPYVRKSKLTLDSQFVAAVVTDPAVTATKAMEDSSTPLIKFIPNNPAIVVVILVATPTIPMLTFIRISQFR